MGKARKLKGRPAHISELESQPGVLVNSGSSGKDRREQHVLTTRPTDSAFQPALRKSEGSRTLTSPEKHNLKLTTRLKDTKSLSTQQQKTKPVRLFQRRSSPQPSFLFHQPDTFAGSNWQNDRKSGSREKRKTKRGRDTCSIWYISNKGSDTSHCGRTKDSACRTFQGLWNEAGNLIPTDSMEVITDADLEINFDIECPKNFI